MTKHAWLGVAVLLLAGRAGAQDTTRTAPTAPRNDEADLSTAVAEKRDAQGRRCDLHATARSGALRYLACGEAGVWVVRVAPGKPPEVLEQRATPGTATSFFVRNGVLWVETTTIQAERLAPVEANATVQAAGALPPPPAPAPTPAGPEATPAPAEAPKAPLAPSPYVATEPAPVTPKPPARGSGVRAAELDPEPARVVGLEPGFAVIDMGSSHGVTTGDHVAFERSTEERVDDQHTAERKERVAVGNATTVGRTRTRVSLGIGERVEVGMRARPTRDPLTASSFAPPRIGGIWHAGFMAKPFLVVDNLGVGVAFEGRAGYRAAYPMHFEVVAKPVGFATGREGGVFAGGAVITASFDSRLFEVGLGVGGQTVNDPSFDLESGSGTTIAQRLRIGAVDGGMIEVFSYVVLFHSEFEFSDLHAQAQLPVGEQSWLVLHAGGGSVGIGYADIGLRVLLQGHAEAGSLFFTASIGGMHMFNSDFDEVEGINFGSLDYTGPMVGVGAEWRF